MKNPGSIIYTSSISTGSLAPSGSVPHPQAPAQPRSFQPWQPITWPPPPQSFSASFHGIVKRILTENIIDEIDNIISDIQRSNKSNLEHRGHVVAIVLLCAVDAIASYAYNNLKSTGQRYETFIREHFPAAYKPHAKKIYKLHRNSAVHAWNLFEATILPGNQQIKDTGGIISFGLLNFFDALKAGLTDFLDKLKNDATLQANVLQRYKEHKAIAK
jgi:hypothetical protein